MGSINNTVIRLDRYHRVQSGHNARLSRSIWEGFEVDSSVGGHLRSGVRPPQSFVGLVLWDSRRGIFQQPMKSVYSGGCRYFQNISDVPNAP